ncbi:MAG: DUF4124 domain-containing protein [Gammaproteobacteria bacterium]|nr:DUF4124 domain-containing protein [Gammaproteobacteria bacterium]
MQAWAIQSTHGIALRQGLKLAALVVTALGLLAPDIGDAAEKKKSHRARPGESSGQVYRWVDDQGVVHFGDAVPAEYAPIDRQVLNQYGITVRTEQGALTEEEIEAERKAAAEKKAALAAARRDEVLLSTYLSVEEIEALRNRRMELIAGQISVTNNYLQSLRERLKQLQAEASAYKPYSKDPDAEPIDRRLADELADTADSIALYEKTLEDTRTRQGRVVMAFDADIARFKELTGR